MNTIDINRRALLLGLAGLGLCACSGGHANKSNLHAKVAFQSGDECHLCGMTIARFPGPKGELYDSENRLWKFCSTRDLFSWYLQPEHVNSIQDIYVHNMANTPWDKPSDSQLISARQAWYVMNSDMPGAMGPTLASFGDKSGANHFIEKHHGKLLRFQDINLEMMTAMIQQKADKMGSMKGMPMMPGSHSTGTGMGMPHGTSAN
jgi:copper chaperone NosL